MTGISQSLDAAQSRVEAKLFDGSTTCHIGSRVRGISEDTFDRTAGSWAPALDEDSSLYDGPCLVKIESVTPIEDGGDPTAEVRATAKIPMSVLGVYPGAPFAVTASRDPDLVGRVFRVTAVYGGALKVLRRLELVEYRRATSDTPAQPDE